MKVLHVLPIFSGFCGGPVEVVTQLCNALKEQGVEVAIATTKMEPSAEGGAIPVYSFDRQFSSFLPSEFAFSWGLKNWLKGHIAEFDLVHIHYLFTYPSTIAAYYARKHRIPYILRPTGMLNPFCLQQNLFKKIPYFLLFEKRNLRNAAAIHFVSEGEISAARNLNLSEKYILVPHGLGLEKFKGMQLLKGQFRKHYPKAAGKKIILLLARIDPIKGLDLLIPALKQLSKKRNDFIFVLAGPEMKNYGKWVRRALTSAGLMDLTILTGLVKDTLKLALLADSDVFILPSYHENFGMAVVEAMASGLPVIISNKVNIHGLIEGFKAGIVTELDSQEIASAIDKLLSDECLRQEMSDNGRKLVEDKFDLQRTAKEMLEWYHRLIRIRSPKWQVKNYWEEEVCCSRYGASEDRRRWFKEIEQTRYRNEPYIPGFAKFKEARGKHVLEIGVGPGADFINWARNQALATGIDLTESSIRLTKEYLSLEGVGKKYFNLCLADAEELPFKEDTFEMVYAWGVLHHTPNTEKALKEIYRVLGPSGSIKIMIYHLPSWTGWMLWVRFSLLRLRPWQPPREAIFRYLESPGTKAYTFQEAKAMLEKARFKEVKISPVLGPGDLLCIRPSKRYRAFIYRIFWVFYPRWLVRALGNRFGLELLLEARK